MSLDNGNNEENVSGISKFVPTIVLISAIIGFVSLAWYAYDAGKQSIKDDDLVVIEAEKTPMKEEPKNPGGMQFPNQDKTIFDTFSSNQTPAKTEYVLPPPEEPIDKSEAIEAAIEKKTSKISDNEKKPVSSKPDKVEVKTVETVDAEDEEAEIPKKYEAKTSEAKIDNKVSEETDEEAPVKTSDKSDGIKIQLGAYSSENEANENWNKLQKRISVLADKSPIIVQANVKGKTYHRLRVGSFSDKNEAKSFCKTVSAKGQACILVTK